MFGNSFYVTPKGVRSLTDIPRGTTVGPCPVDVCFNMIAEDEIKESYAIEVALCNGEIRRKQTMPIQTLPNDWLLYVQAARDNHEQNLELIQNGAYVYVTFTKDVLRGERLLVWYGLDVVRTLGIPVLRPQNIVANNRYACTRCQQTYAFPNSLKSHLRICNQFDGFSSFASKATIPFLYAPWMLQYYQATNQLLKTPYGLRASKVNTLPGELVRPLVEKSITCAPINRVTPSLLRKSRPSLIRVPEFHTPNYRHAMYQRDIVVDEQDAEKKQYFLHSTLEMSKNSEKLIELEKTSPTTSATFERSLIASNFRIPPPHEVVGEPLDVLPLHACRHQRGHICVYCGKLYSRKYGLKIHLRTHTGYKPLKCKVCCRSFGDPSNLNKHIRLHAQGDSPYRCSHCDKILVRRRDLERHVKSRHPAQVESNPTDTDILTEDESESDTSLSAESPRADNELTTEV